MENCKRMQAVNGEIPLPEAMIQHIQSFLSGKEAARTTILSKSWYSAWLTRPALDFDLNDFFRNRHQGLRDTFKEFAENTMRRYEDLNLNIERFRLRSSYNEIWAPKVIAHAMKIGATDVEIKLSSVTLPREVLGSKTLLRLSVSECNINGNYVRCSNLKSLNLKYVIIENDHQFKEIISCCVLLEELSLFWCFSLKVSRMNLYKLRHLYLECVGVDSMFFTDFASRFPCLKDLRIVHCTGCKRIEIASTTLELITFHIRESWTASFYVPNIRKFSNSGFTLPRFPISGALREWKLDISITCNRFNKLSWFLQLKKLLTNFRLSRIISLFIKLDYGRRCTSVHKVETEVVAEPLVVDNLMIDAPAKFCCPLLVRLLGICRPKCIVHYWWRVTELSSLVVVYNGLMHKLITPICGIPDQDVFGQFGMKEVNMKVYEEFGTEWRPLVLEQPLVLKGPLGVPNLPENRHKLRFGLAWV